MWRRPCFLGKVRLKVGAQAGVEGGAIGARAGVEGGAIGARAGAEGGAIDA
jgi:hypothetical protein